MNWAVWLVMVGTAVPSLATLFLPGLSSFWSYEPQNVPLHRWIGAWLPAAGQLVIALGLVGLLVQRRLPWWGGLAPALLVWVALPGLLPAPSGCAPFPWLLQLTLPALAWRLPARDTAARRWRLLALGAPVWMVLSLVLYILLPDAPADTPLILAWPPLLLPWAALAWLAGRHEENPAAPISPAQLTVR